MKKNFRKIRLSGLIALSAASVAFAQTGISPNKAKDGGETRAYVQSNNGAGGFGDAKINIRGFDQRNYLVNFNGIPVNDVESGGVNWGNFSILADATTYLNVQKGMGVSKIALPSVGGAINMETDVNAEKRGGHLFVGLGNNGNNHRAAFSYNTGKSKSGLSSSIFISRTAGSMYSNGTDFEGYNYFFGLGYTTPNKKHSFQISNTGAPQQHEQKSYAPSIAQTIKYSENGEPDRKYNITQGYLNGRAYNINSDNIFQPITSLNWKWNINDKTKLETVAYMSFRRGGGGVFFGTSENGSTVEAFRKANGDLDYDAIYAANQANTNPTLLGNLPNVIVKRGVRNNHNMYGAMTNLTHVFNDNWKLSAGIDGRYYKGIHYYTIGNMLGAKYVPDNSLYGERRDLTNVYSNNVLWTLFGEKNKEEKLSTYWESLIPSYSAHGQIEYNKNHISAYAQAAISTQGYQRFDYMKDKDLPKTDMKYKMGYDVKGGLNYYFNEHHYVMGNAGFFQRQPLFSAVFYTNKNVKDPSISNEKITSFEIGYGYKSTNFNASVTLYDTTWDNFSKTATLRTSDISKNRQANIPGISEIHKGVEVAMNAKLWNRLTLAYNMQVGDWYVKDDVQAALVDEITGAVVETKTLHIKNYKVGGGSGAAQFTADLKADLKVTDWMKLNGSYHYNANQYSDYKPDTTDPLVKLPDYGVLALGASTNFKLKNGHSLGLKFGINNVLDKTYITWMQTNIPASVDAKENWNGINVKNQVFFGDGRTWNAGIDYRF